MVARKVQHFDILISPAWRPMLRVIGVKPENAFVEVTADECFVKFGRFEHTFPLDAIETAEMTQWPLWAGIGPRYVPGTLAFIGTFLNTVVVRFAEDQHSRFVFPLGFRRLFLSLREPEKFIGAVTTPAVAKKVA